jgi:hypothetical protein
MAMLSLPIAFSSAIGVLAPGKRTVTAILQIMGRNTISDFQTYHRVLNRAVWSPLTASRLLLRGLQGLSSRVCLQRGRRLWPR